MIYLFNYYLCEIVRHLSLAKYIFIKHAHVTFLFPFLFLMPIIVAVHSALNGLAVHIGFTSS